MPSMARPKKTYHRENLEQALIAKAAEIIASRGVDGLSLRELGRCAGVSRTAAYHYFPDKATLLAKVGEQGFHKLGARIARESSQAKTQLEQLRRGLHGYVRFALEDPHFFRLMFANMLERELPTETTPGGLTLMFSSTAAQQAFAALLDGIREMQRAKRLQQIDPLLLMNVLWAFTHGVAVLALDRHLKGYDYAPVLDAGLDALIGAYGSDLHEKA
jgi:AcrR family transcriptional regulator